MNVFIFFKYFFRLFFWIFGLQSVCFSLALDFKSRGLSRVLPLIGYMCLCIMFIKKKL